MNDSTMGAITFLLGVVLIILYFATPYLLWALYWILAVILIVYGLYQWLVKK